MVLKAVSLMRSSREFRAQEYSSIYKSGGKKEQERILRRNNNEVRKKSSMVSWKPGKRKSIMKKGAINC